MSDQGWLILHLVLTCTLAALAWSVHVVQAPVLCLAGGQRAALQRASDRRSLWLFGPLVLLEAFTGLAVMARPLGREPLAEIAFVALVGLWVVSFGADCRHHERPLRPFSPQRRAQRRWMDPLRAAIWTLRVPLLVALLIGS